MADSPRIEELKRRVHSDPASIAFAALAEEYRRTGRYDEAITVCRTGLARHPSYISAHVTLGRALLEVGRYDEAREELEHVLQVAPENLAAIRGLADIHHRQGQKSEATGLSPAIAEMAAALSPAEPPAPVVPPADVIAPRKISRAPEIVRGPEALAPRGTPRPELTQPPEVTPPLQVVRPAADVAPLVEGPRPEEPARPSGRAVPVVDRVAPRTLVPLEAVVTPETKAPPERAAPPVTIAPPVEVMPPVTVAPSETVMPPPTLPPLVTIAPPEGEPDYRELVEALGPLEDLAFEQFGPETPEARPAAVQPAPPARPPALEGLEAFLQAIVRARQSGGGLHLF